MTQALKILKRDQMRTATAARIKAEEQLTEQILDGIDGDARDEILLHLKHLPCGCCVEIKLPGHRTIRAMTPQIFIFTMRPVFGIFKRNWKRLWLTEKLSSKHATLVEAIAAAEKKSGGGERHFENRKGTDEQED